MRGWSRKAVCKGRTQAEVDQAIRWLTGYFHGGGAQEADRAEDRLRDLLREGAGDASGAAMITGTICGHRVEEIEEPLMREIRYLDKPIDELAKGKAMEKVP